MITAQQDKICYGYNKQCNLKEAIRSDSSFNITHDTIEKVRKISRKWASAQSHNEAQDRPNYFRDFFCDILGYTWSKNDQKSTFAVEIETDTDATKADAALGFGLEKEKSDRDIRVIIEMKGGRVDLDVRMGQGKFNAVEQGFNYTHKIKGKPEFVIVSNFTEIRLYESHESCEHHKFHIKQLAESDAAITEFIYLLSFERLFTKIRGQSSTHQVISRSRSDERTIENKFYKEYSETRSLVWKDLKKNNPEYDPEALLSYAQKIMDKCLFILFAEDNGIIPGNEFTKAIKGQYGTYWQNLKSFFSVMNRGSPNMYIPKLNGRLFKEEPVFNSLELGNEAIEKVMSLSKWDFESKLSISILGHVFEQSIADLEKERAQITESEYDSKHSKRKKDGVYYTPEYITRYMVADSLSFWIDERKAEIGLDRFDELTEDEMEVLKNAKNGKKIDKSFKKKAEEKAHRLLSAWAEYANKLKNIKIIDPSCGSGAFLVQVFDYLEKEWKYINDVSREICDLLGEGSLFKIEHNYEKVLQNNIYGVDINHESVHITKLSLWLRTAYRKEPLTTLDANIKVGNSLIEDPEIAGTYYDDDGIKQSLAFKYEKEFPEVFGDSTETEREGGENAKPKGTEEDSLDSSKKEDIGEIGSKEANEGEIGSKEANEGEKITTVRTDDTKGNAKKDAERRKSGFDIVIGNPPYVFSRSNKFTAKEKEYFYKKYKYAIYQINTYALFIEKGNSLLNQNTGILNFIIPTSWLTILTYKGFREFIIKDTSNTKIIHAPRDTFIDVGINTCILSFTTKGDKSNIVIGKMDKEEKSQTDINGDKTKKGKRKKDDGDEEDHKKISVNIELDKFNKNRTVRGDSLVIDLDAKENAKFDGILSKVKNRSVELESIANVVIGIKAYQVNKGEPKQTKEMVSCRIYHSFERQNENYLKYVGSSDVGRYSFLWSKEYIHYGECIAEPRNKENFNEDRILIRQILSQHPCIIQSTFLNEEYVNDINTMIVRDFSTQYHPKFILSIINSKLISRWLSIMLSKDLCSIIAQFKIAELKKLPIPNIPLSEQQPLAEMAGRMMELHSHLNEQAQKFINRIKKEHNNPEKISKKLMKWYNLEEAEFMSEIQKLCEQQKIPSHTLSQKDDWCGYFAEHKTDVVAILEEIRALDDKIDEAIYQIYSLDEDEIKIMSSL